MLDVTSERKSNNGAGGENVVFPMIQGSQDAGEIAAIS